jgi:hypothetical protein
LELLESVDPTQRRERDPPDADDRQRRRAAAITVVGVPNACAARPLSNAPSSFDAPMKTFSTARTRPRFSSGVTRGTIDPRMNTLTMSAALSTTSEMNATR